MLLFAQQFKALSLNEYLKLIHLTEAPEEQPAAVQPQNVVPCEECGKAFGSRAHHSEHNRYMHTGTACYYPGCYATTPDEASLHQHLAFWHPYRIAHNGRYHCGWPSCTKSFVNSTGAVRCTRFHQYDAMKASE